jgi:hypothetical protein
MKRRSVDVCWAGKRRLPSAPPATHRYFPNCSGAFVDNQRAFTYRSSMLTHSPVA